MKIDKNRFLCYECKQILQPSYDYKTNCKKCKNMRKFFRRINKNVFLLNSRMNF